MMMVGVVVFGGTKRNRQKTAAEMIETEGKR